MKTEKQQCNMLACSAPCDFHKIKYAFWIEYFCLAITQMYLIISKEMDKRILI